MDIKELTKKVDLVSVSYTKKFKIKRDSDWFILKLQEELGELIQAYLMLEKKARTKGKSQKEIKALFESEIADVFCHILLLAKYYNIDVQNTVEQKWLSWINK